MNRSPIPKREVEGMLNLPALSGGEPLKRGKLRFVWRPGCRTLHLSFGLDPDHEAVWSDMERSAPVAEVVADQQRLVPLTADWSPPGARRTPGPPDSPGYRGTGVRRGRGRTRRSLDGPRGPLLSPEFARDRGRRNRPHPRSGPIACLRRPWGVRTSHNSSMRPAGTRGMPRLVAGAPRGDPGLR